MASARNYKLSWSREEQFSTQLWMLNDRYEHVEPGVLRATLMAGNKIMELGSWEFGIVKANTNLEGPVLKTVLPRWASGGFILHLEVVGHPEYSSEYTFLLSDKQPKQ